MIFQNVLGKKIENITIKSSSEPVISWPKKNNKTQINNFGTNDTESVLRLID